MKNIISFIAIFVLLMTLVPFQQAEANAVKKHYTVDVTKLEIREKPSPKAKTVGSLKKGQVVFVYNTEPGGWSKIKYNNKAGYIATSGLKGSENAKKTAGKAENKHYIVINTTKLNVREKPSLKSKIVGSLKKGATVFVYNTEPGGWSKIKYNGKAAYVSSSYLFAVEGTMNASKEEKVQAFLNQLSSTALRNDMATLYDMMHWAHKSTTKKSEFIKEQLEEDIHVKKFNIKSIQIFPNSTYIEEEMKFFKVLVDIDLEQVSEGKKSTYKGKAYIYLAEVNNKYGFVFEDDWDYLGKWK